MIAALAKGAHVPASEVSTTHVGPTWGSQITHRAILALIVFFIVVAIYISFRFEPKMALAAFIAMIHDLLVTIGIYSLAGFQVTPDTVIAVLTILGYSLYDTVVVFDRVRDNTKGFGASGRMTYSEMINLSMNQTLARSINTSLVAILPVLSVLVIGAEILGATTLQYYGLALTVGPVERGLLVDLHRLAGAGHAQRARAAVHGDPPAPGEPGRAGRPAHPGRRRPGRGRRGRGARRASPGRQRVALDGAAAPRPASPQAGQPVAADGVAQRRLPRRAAPTSAAAVAGRGVRCLGRERPTARRPGRARAAGKGKSKRRR